MIKIVLKNYQIHDKLELEFDSFLCILGESNKGKTAILRAIDDLLFQKIRNIDRIKNDKLKAEIYLTYNDITIGKIIYRDKPIEFVENGTVIKKSANILGKDLFAKHSIYFDTLNYQNQSRGHFFITESPATAGEIISHYCGIEVPKLLASNLKKEILSNNKLQTKFGKELDTINEKLTPEFLEKYKLYKIKCITLETYNDNINLLNKKIETFNLIIKYINLKDKLLNILFKFSILFNLNDKFKKYNSLNTIYKHKKKFSILEKMCKKYNILIIINKKENTIYNNIEKLKKHIKLTFRYNKIIILLELLTKNLIIVKNINNIIIKGKLLNLIHTNLDKLTEIKINLNKLLLDNANSFCITCKQFIGNIHDEKKI